MTIEDRNLEPGTKLAARYKGQAHSVLVLKDDEGKLGFELDNGTIYKSLSKAGSDVMNGTACNGWRFWSLEGDLPEKKEAASKEAKGKVVKLIKRVPNQKGVDEGSTKWFCGACMKSFVTDTTDEPDACPQGHPKLAEEEIAVDA